MQIFVNKLSNVNENWSLDVEPSDSIEGVRAMILDKEAPGLFTNPSKVRLFRQFGSELQDGLTLFDYSIEQGQQISAVYTSDITVCCPSSSIANGLYNIWGWDPSGKNVYIRNGGLTFYKVFYDGEESKWKVDLEWGGGDVVAYSSVIPSLNAITPYNETAFPANDVGVWGNGTIILEGDVSCPLVDTCDSRFDRHAYGDECGADRFRRLRLLGYV